MASLLPPKAFCLVCGCEESEVEKLHYFPSAVIKSQLWQEKMGIVFSGDSLRNHRICNRHLTDESYLNHMIRKFRRDAVPTFLPCLAISTGNMEHAEASTSGADKCTSGELIHET